VDLVHAGVSRRSIRRLGDRAAASLGRSGQQEKAGDLLKSLMEGRYHDEQMLSLEILDHLAGIWPEWAGETVTILSRKVRHPWVADRLAQIQGRLIAQDPSLMSRHVLWAVSPNPLRRRASAMALLARARGRRGTPVAKALPVLRLLLEDLEPHPWVQQGLGHAIVFYARRAPTTMARLLRDYPEGLSPRHRARAEELLRHTGAER
jgi:hypothetical protein